MKKRKDRSKKTNKANVVEPGERKPYEHSQAFLEKQRAAQDRFLAALRETHGRQLEACKMSNVSIDAVLDWREDEKSDFSKRFLRAMAIVPIAAQDEAIRRGVTGYEGRGVFFKGKKIQKITEYSDGMLSRLLAATDKRFRPGDIDVEDENGKIVVKVTRYA